MSRPHSTFTLTLVTDSRGNVSVRTDLPHPTVGSPVSPVVSIGLDLLMHCQHEDLDITYGAAHVPAVGFALDVASPEGHGWAVEPAVRAAAGDVIRASQHGNPRIKPAATAEVAQ